MAEESEPQAAGEAPQPVKKRKWITLLAKITYILSSGNYGRLMLKSIDNQNINICRWNLGDDEAKKIHGKWYFILVEYRDNDLYYNRHVPVDPTTLELLKLDYWHKAREAKQLLANKGKESEDTDDNQIKS
jgi:hypothetical protein